MRHETWLQQPFAAQELGTIARLMAKIYERPV